MTWLEAVIAGVEWTPDPEETKPKVGEIIQLLRDMAAKSPPSKIPLPPSGRCCYPKDTSAAMRHWSGLPEDDPKPDVVIVDKRSGDGIPDAADASLSADGDRGVCSDPRKML